VRAAFAKEDIRYDEAQAGMELAGLYLEQGRTAGVKRLVLQMEPVFRAKGSRGSAEGAPALPPGAGRPGPGLRGVAGLTELVGVPI